MSAALLFQNTAVTTSKTGQRPSLFNISENARQLKDARELAHRLYSRDKRVKQPITLIKY
jgi:hypothetical protein